MNEGTPKPPSNEGKKNEWEHKAEFLALALELSKSHEAFTFPGIDPERYAELKAEEEQFSGFTTPIDEQIKRFQSEGMRVVIPPDQPNEASILIMPKNSSDESDDLNENSLTPSFFNSNSVPDEKLKRLIELSKEKYTKRDPKRVDSTPDPRIK